MKHKDLATLDEVEKLRAAIERGDHLVTFAQAGAGDVEALVHLASLYMVSVNRASKSEPMDSGLDHHDSRRISVTNESNPRVELIHDYLSTARSSLV